jgi:hypothetical protein
VFSETRYALNGDLRVAYRASREGPRDIVFLVLLVQLLVSFWGLDRCLAQQGARK